MYLSAILDYLQQQVQNQRPISRFGSCKTINPQNCSSPTSYANNGSFFFCTDSRGGAHLASLVRPPYHQHVAPLPLLRSHPFSLEPLLLEAPSVQSSFQNCPGPDGQCAHVGTRTWRR
jgi:hypothetical protein